MVFWGHDVRHPEGNALVRHGMVKTRSLGLSATSCYSMDWENGRIDLHGAVASWTAPEGGTGCIFSRDRGRIDLWQESAPPIPGRQHGEAGSHDERWAAFQPFLRWLVGYEQWVNQDLGEDYRHSCWRALKRLPKGKPWLPPHLAIQWWRLATATNPPRPKVLLEW
jgi:hypothetical protein